MHAIDRERAEVSERGVDMICETSWPDVVKEALGVILVLGMCYLLFRDSKK